MSSFCWNGLLFCGACPVLAHNPLLLRNGITTSETELPELALPAPLWESTKTRSEFSSIPIAGQGGQSRLAEPGNWLATGIISDLFFRSLVRWWSSCVRLDEVASADDAASLIGPPRARSGAAAPQLPESGQW